MKNEFLIEPLKTRDPLRERVRSLFEFLKAFHQLRNPTIIHVDQYPKTYKILDLPDHFHVKVSAPCLENENNQGALSSDSFELSVKKIEIDLCPFPPDDIIAYITGDWKNPSSRINLDIPKPNEDNGDLIDFEKITNLFIEWNVNRVTWQTSAIVALGVKNFYESLFRIYNDFQRDSETLELIICDGIFACSSLGRAFKHPILSRRLEINFDAEDAILTLREADGLTDLYSEHFQQIPNIDTRAVSIVDADLRDKNVSPVGTDITNDFLKSTVNRLFPNGLFLNLNDSEFPSTPIIYRDPMIILRKRSQGYARLIENILADIDDGGEISKALGLLAGFETVPDPQDSSSLTESVYANEDEDILFALPANAEQLTIAKRLSKYGNVIVQGPPGTGKTHTIANLIGHLLAQGKSILVTSHKGKALNVLKEKLPDKLKPLCVMVLDKAEFDRNDLKDSVEGIVERMAGADAQQLEREAQNYSVERKEAIQKLQQTRTQMIDLLRGEDATITIQCAEVVEVFRPLEAARWLSDNKIEHGWMPDSLPLNADVPLTEDKIIRLYGSNATIPLADESELRLGIPRDSIYPPQEFAKLVEAEAQTRKRLSNIGSNYWLDDLYQAKSSEIRSIRNSISAASKDITGDEPWREAVVESGLGSDTQRELWTSLIDEAKALQSKYSKAQVALLTHGPKLSEGIEPEAQLVVFREIADHLQNGRSLSTWLLLWKIQWKSVIETSKVNGQRPTQTEHFQALATLVDLAIERNKFTLRWNNQMARYGASLELVNSETIEPSLNPQREQLEKCIEWGDSKWQKIVDAMPQIGFNWDAFSSDHSITTNSAISCKAIRAALASLADVLDAQENRLQLKEIDAKLGLKAAELNSIANPASATKALLGAIVDKSISRYEEATIRLDELHRLQAPINERYELLNQMRQFTPIWSAQIELRVKPHDQSRPPSDVKSAWKWRKLHDEVTRRNSQTIAELQLEYNQLKSRVEALTSKRIEAATWAAQARRTNLERRSALKAWQKMMNQVGRGTGILANHMLAQAQQQLNMCRSSVPVWIMPFKRVIESFDPKNTKFDVIIMDESSQSDITELIAFYLGSEIIIVGDDEQVSPNAVGQEMTPALNLIDQYLKDIPNKDVYNPLTSAYDIASICFGGAVCLKEHFRCVPEIIRFSNELSYRRQIKPLRESGSAKVFPALVSYYVSDGEYHHKINHNEALAVASIIVAASEQPEHYGLTFGVISLIGDEQARRIESILYSRMPLNEYQQRKIICGNASDFQGDERNIMFLSVVNSPVKRLLPALFDNQGKPNQRYKKRLNVAASRAQDQMWVVHSVMPGIHLQPGDMRGRLIDHAQNPEALKILQEDSANLAESDFERDVIKRLNLAGFKTISQYKVGNYRIDIVITDDVLKLAVDCDGDRYHTIENHAEDMERQAILERLSWTFVRIRGSSYYLDPEHEIEAVIDKAKRMGIRNCLYTGAEQSGIGAKKWNELSERVIVRAQEVRLQWENQDLPSGANREHDTILQMIEEDDFQFEDQTIIA